jgi:hypothetical protein
MEDAPLAHGALSYAGSPSRLFRADELSGIERKLDPGLDR